MSKLRSYTAEELEDKLIRAAEDLRALRGQLPLLGVDAAIFDSQYRQDKAKNYFLADKELVKREIKATDTARNMLIDEICTERREKAHVATNLYKANIQVAKSLETEITVYQSLIRREEKERQFANVEDRSGRAQPTTSILKEIVPTDEPPDFETSFEEKVKDPWDE